MAVDCVIFGWSAGQLKLLLFKRKVAPFKGEWSLIGSFVKANESLDQSAIRVLKESTGLTNIFMEPVGSFSAVDRDPGARVISTAYSALIRVDKHEEQQLADFQAKWFDWQELPSLILDHQEMVNQSIDQLRLKAKLEPIGFELLPAKFSLPQLQALYEAIYQQPVDSRNFRKKILSLGILDKLDEKDKTNSKKGAYLYQLDIEKYKASKHSGIKFLI